MCASSTTRQIWQFTGAGGMPARNCGKPKFCVTPRTSSERFRWASSGQSYGRIARQRVGRRLQRSNQQWGHKAKTGNYARLSRASSCKGGRQAAVIQRAHNNAEEDVARTTSNTDFEHGPTLALFQKIDQIGPVSTWAGHSGR